MDATARRVVAARVARTSDLLCGACLAVLALLKLPLLGASGVPVASLGAGAVEVAIACSLFLGRTPGLSAALLVGLGAVTTAWTGLKVTGLVAAGPCGCFGLARPSDLMHALVAAALLFAGGWQTYLLSSRRTG